VAEKTEKYWWTDKTLQTPKEIWIPGTPGEAKAVYGTMKGFGPESRAGIDAVAKRLDWTVPKTRTWQKVLWSLGWITLLREGENQEPRQWWMASYPFEQPPQELVARVSKNGTLPPQAYGKAQGAGNPAPGKPVPEANKALEPNKGLDKEQTNKTSVKHPDQDQAWADLKAVWTKKHLSAAPLAWPAKTMKNWQVLLTAELLRLGREELVRRWSNMVNDPWVQASLRAFIQDTDKWVTLREKGATNARAFNQPAADTWTPSAPVQK